MKYKIEFTEKQVKQLQQRNTSNLPMTSFLKMLFGFSSVEVVEEKKPVKRKKNPSWLGELAAFDRELEKI